MAGSKQAQVLIYPANDLLLGGAVATNEGPDAVSFIGNHIIDMFAVVNGCGIETVILYYTVAIGSNMSLEECWVFVSIEANGMRCR